MTHRFFPNRLPDWTGHGTVRSQSNIVSFQKSLKECLDYILSEANNSKDASVYTGSSGIAYTCCRVASKPSISPNSPALLAESFHISSGALQSHQHRHQWSLLLGQAGSLLVHATICNQRLLLSQSTQPQTPPPPTAIIDQRNRCISDYLNLHTLTLDTQLCQEDEFLYGRAGYLFGCLLINKILSPSPPSSSIDAITHPVLQQLLTIGRQTSSSLHQSSTCPLLYVWPPGSHHHHQSPPYLGAAHGLMGVLYTMLHFPHHLTTIPGAWEDVERCLEYILTLECEDGDDDDDDGDGGGNYPSRVVLYSPKQEEIIKEKRQPLVQWCHGAPGAIFLFTKAHECFSSTIPTTSSSSNYMEAAERAGEAVWNRGLLTKGPGLCHGISGSAYSMLRLYKCTKKEKWLHRAIEMAKFMSTDEDFKRLARVPDRPKSLFEGWGGAACLYADLLEVMATVMEGGGGERGDGVGEDVMDRVGFPFFEV